MQTLADDCCYLEEEAAKVFEKKPSIKKIEDDKRARVFLAIKQLKGNVERERNVIVSLDKCTAHSVNLERRTLMCDLIADL